MRLESARELKQELTGVLKDTGLAQSFAVLGTAGVAHEGRILKPRISRKARTGPPQGIAIGITPSRTKSGHKLALRLQDPTPEAHQYAAYAAGKARDEIDIQYVGAISAGQPAPASGYERRVRPLQPGYSVGHYRITAGTLGGFVRDARKRLGILSNNHVLGNTNAGKRGDDILQPGAYDAGRRPGDVVAALERLVRLKAGSNAVDAAWAVIDSSLVKVNPRYGTRKLGAARPAEEIVSAAAVWKIGRTTGLTRGTISAIELDHVAVGYDKATYSFDGQIEVVGDEGPFSEGGDSGSFILGSDDAGVALLFAGSEEGGPKGSGRTYATPLETALSLLGLELALES
ncbi:MAG TPA: hypothetical protein VE964_09000 [Myxococcales bacterium]|nr:hypothetical protein [Myxococcales bacterium]